MDVVKSQKKRNLFKVRYRKIDESISMEWSLRNELTKTCNSLRLKEKNDLTKGTIFKITLWVIFISISTAILHFMFDTEGILAPLIITTVIITPLMFLWLSSSSMETMRVFENQIVEKEKNTYKQIVSMYSKLLSGINVYDFLNIPQDISFDNENLPLCTTYDLPAKKYGKYTRYTTALYGTKYHAKRGCSGAYFPIHTYTIALKTHYAPCLICVGRTDEIIIPEWYTYFLKVKRITDEYDISIDIPQSEPKFGLNEEE